MSLVIHNILESVEVGEYLKERSLVDRYKKAKAYILGGHFGSVDFKIREPKSKKIYQFRISQKYRCYSYVEEENLIVFYISDHQQ
ncbi:MAG: hypothetical protein ACK4NC_04050 [Candidatus Gracilibacteria bacterium]